MVGQQRQMQHLRIGDDHIGREFPDAFAAIGGRITVIDGTCRPRRFQLSRQVFKRLQLILRQRL